MNRSGPLPCLEPTERQQFFEQFYRTEQPVLVRNVPVPEGDVETLCAELSRRIGGDPRSMEEFLWYSVTPATLADLCPPPPIVAEQLNERTAFIRPNPVRVWYNEVGHRTAWHYDGNSIHVFSLQLKGRKRWRIIGPETPITCAPFHFLGLSNEYSMEGRHSYEFETSEGDLLFLPRYWAHCVDSLAEHNLNVNWVLTPRQPAGRTPGARREAEIVWLKSRLPWLLSPKERDFFKRYAGVGREAIDLICREVSPRDATLRVLTEVVRAPLLLTVLPGILTNMRVIRRAVKSLRANLKTPDDSGG